MTAAAGDAAGRLSLGVMARSRKENERRLPLHPQHLGRIPEDLRESIYLERGYGDRFGMSDDQLKGWVGGFRTREQLVEECDVILQPKPLLSDIAELRVGQVLWGWPHCVQDEELTQLAIDQKLTLIAFEAMNHWNRDGSFSLHVFHKNNELAGYCSVLHALQIAGSTGDYGRRLRAVVIGFGATARGAVTALNALGVHDVDVLTHREIAAVAAPIHSARIVHFDSDGTADAGEPRGHGERHGAPRGVPRGARHHRQLRAAGHRRPADVPDRRRPPEADARHPDRRRLVRRGHGVQLGAAHDVRRPDLRRRATTCSTTPSTTARPTCGTPRPGRSARRCCPSSGTVLGGPDAWDADPTIRRAIEIRDGVIQNPAILSFQGRDPKHPHFPLAT